MEETFAHQLQAAVQALRAVVQATQTFRRHFADNHDLTITDTMAMSHLVAAGPSSAGELASRTGLAPSSITSLLDRLERVGLAARTTPPGNRRAVEVTLTDAGVAALHETEPWLYRALLKLGENKLPEFTRCLQILAVELQQAAVDYAALSAYKGDQPA